jgi:cytochrome c oxidase cbb3-type subunit 3
MTAGSHPSAEGRPTGGDRAAAARRRIGRSAIAAVAVALAVFAFTQVRDHFMGRELLMESPDRIPSEPDLMSYANSVGKAAFAANCASCHGVDMKGSQAKGIPNLTDNIWLYDFGRVSDIERTVLYGIRAGLGKSHNVTDMPAIGRQKALSPSEVKDVVAYVRALNKHQADDAAATRGERLFQDKGVCYDCHGRDATGVSDYGAPNLIDNDWLYGDDEQTLYKSVYDGRHGMCPTWIGRLSFPTIRAIAVYIHSMSQESPESPNRSVANGDAVESG